MNSIIQPVSSSFCYAHHAIPKRGQSQTYENHKAQFPKFTLLLSKIDLSTDDVREKIVGEGASAATVPTVPTVSDDKEFSRTKPILLAE